MVLVQVGSQVVLTTSHTTTTRVLSVLAYTTVSGRHMAANYSQLSVFDSLAPW
jgi:hypothetical protein